MVNRTSAILVSILLFGMPALGALAETPHNDASSGGDAPDDSAQALGLAPGAYIGNLTPGNYDNDADSYEGSNVTIDQDWYRADSAKESTLACTQASYQPDEKPHNETRIHLHEPSLEHAWLNATTDATGATLSMVGPDASDTVLGLTAMDPPRVTEYALDFDVLTIEEAADAGNEELIPGPCFGDMLNEGEEHEWAFDATEGEFLFLSFGTGLDRPDELTLTAPNGTEVGSITSEDSTALGAITLDATGIWTLTASGTAASLLPLDTSQSDYLVGFSLIDGPDDDDDDDRRPCRPHCIS